MEKVIEVFDKLNVKSQNLQDAITFLNHKPKLSDHLSQLKKENNETKALAKEVKEEMKHFESVQRDDYEKVSERTKRVQLKMLYLLEHFNRMEGKLVNKSRALQPLTLASPKLLEREGASQAFSELNTPRMLVSEYAKSPFAKKRSKVQLQFTDFEADISREDFGRIPSYMKGRVSQAELQDFLDNVVIRTFNDKYRILYQARASLKPAEYNLQLMFKNQSSYFEDGLKFITIGDIARILEKNVEKKDDRFLQMLRHLQIIREARKNSIVCYIWLR